MKTSPTAFPNTSFMTPPSSTSATPTTNAAISNKRKPAMKPPSNSRNRIASPIARYGLGLVRLELGETDLAVADLKRLAETGGVEWRDRGWYQIGRGLLIANRPEAAIEAFETLERIAPKSRLLTTARLDKATALLKLERYDQAAAAIAALTDDPSANVTARAWNLKGRILQAQGKLEPALAIFEGATVRFGQTPFAPSRRSTRPRSCAISASPRRLRAVPQARPGFPQGPVGG